MNQIYYSNFEWWKEHDSKASDLTERSGPITDVFGSVCICDVDIDRVQGTVALLIVSEPIIYHWGVQSFLNW